MTDVKKALTKRFLVEPGSLPDLGPGTTVVTGYMSSDPAVRLRAWDDGAKVQIWTPRDQTRYFEYPIPLDEAESLMELCLQRTMRTTWDVAHGRRVWHVSQYMGRHDGLWTAVLELENRTDGYEEPPWLGRSVTGDRRFTDEGLARLQAPPRP